MFIKMNEVITKLSYSDIVDLYIISDKLNLPCSYHLVIPCKKEDTEMEELSYEQEKQTKISEFYSLLTNEIVQAKMKNKNASYQQSCIINTLRTAYNKFMGTDTSRSECSLYYFSDLIEQCDGKNSDAGKLYFCSSTMYPDFETLQSQIKESYNPKDINLKKYTGNRIYFVRSTEGEGQGRCISESQLNELWYLVLEKVGYSRADLIYFYQ